MGRGLQPDVHSAGAKKVIETHPDAEAPARAWVTGEDLGDGGGESIFVYGQAREVTAVEVE